MPKIKEGKQRKPDEGGGILIPILVAAMVCVVLTTTFIVGYGLQYTAEQRAIEAQQSESVAPARSMPSPSESLAQTVSVPPEDTAPEESAAEGESQPVAPLPSASPPASAAPSVSPSPSSAPPASQSPTPSAKPPESQAPASQSVQSNTPQTPAGNGGGSWGEDSTTNEITGDLSRTAYWTRSGKSYHFSRECPSLSRSKNIYEGTLQDALNANKTDPCNNCAGGS